MPLRIEGDLASSPRQGHVRLAGGASHRNPVCNESVPRQGHSKPPAMPSTHLSLHFHVVFSTKHREARIATEWRDRLHAYLGGVARNSGVIPEIVGGVADHVHLLLGLTATARLADVVRDIKAVSSKWVHEEPGDRAFA